MGRLPVRAEAKLAGVQAIAQTTALATVPNINMVIAIVRVAIFGRAVRPMEPMSAVIIGAGAMEPIIGLKGIRAVVNQVYDSD